MRQTVLLLTTGLLAIALSGCIADEAPPAEEADDLHSDVVNTAPVAGLTASLLNGTAPLNVTFTLEGSDADGDNVTWVFDGGDGNTTANGTSLPATVNATYGVGNWTATLRVSDGQNETVQTLLVTVAEGAPDADLPIPAPGIPAPVYINGSALAPSVSRYTGLGCIDGYGVGMSSDGEYHGMPDVDVTGWNFEVNSGFYVYIYDADLGVLAEGTSGVVPPNSDTVDICSDTAVAEDFSLVFTHPDA